MEGEINDEQKGGSLWRKLSIFFHEYHELLGKFSHHITNYAWCTK